MNFPNQKMVVVVPVDDENRFFEIEANYNEIAEYWTMTIRDVETGKDILTGIPLLTSFGDFANIMKQYGYKNIGSVYVYPKQFTKASRPNDTNLGTDYIILWGDT